MAPGSRTAHPLIVSLTLSLLLVSTLLVSPGLAGDQAAFKEHREAMLKNAEEMIAHGGMGDAKAIVYHCGEVLQHAEAVMKDLPVKDPQAKHAVALLQEAMRHCRRVQQIGDKADPGASLNPASKARSAVRDAVHLLRTLQDHSA